MLQIRTPQRTALVLAQSEGFVREQAAERGVEIERVAQAVERALDLGMVEEEDVLRWVTWQLKHGDALEQQPEVARILQDPGLEPEAKLDELEFVLSPAAAEAASSHGT